MMFLFCILFGLALIANVQATNDSQWFWYASSLRNGKRLYSDLHLALQPFFVLETAWFMSLLGKGWIVSRIPAVLHLIAYALGLRLISRYADWPDRQMAIIMGSAFFISICAGLERLDDYHIATDCFQIYSIVLLLVLQKAKTTGRTLYVSAALGILSGFTFTTRVNDGAALMLAVAIAISCMAPSKRLAAVGLFCISAASTVLLVVQSTGDSMHAYLLNSIFRAVGSKGGAAGVLSSPIRLPWNTLRFLHDKQVDEVILYCMGIVLIWTFLILPSARTGFAKEWQKAVIGLILIFLPVHHFTGALLDARFISDISAITVYILYGFGIVAFVRYLRWTLNGEREFAWNRREILLLVPLGQLMSSSMSSGGFHYLLYGPPAILMLLTPIASPIPLRSSSAKSIFMAVAMVMLCYSLVYKIRVPYSWHSYVAEPMFTDRQWYWHPLYGPMVIQTDMLHFIEPVCKQVGMKDPDQELLSMPYGYANYFCGIPPWHDYVQTYFDTTTQQTMDKLLQELREKPPRWILYERGLKSLTIHEDIYNQGRPLPHRYLDQLIEQRLAQGTWRAVYTSSYGNTRDWDDEWILIRTQP